MESSRKLTRSSSSAAYKKRRSTALGQHKQDNAFLVTNYRDQGHYSEQFQVTLERVIGLTANTNSQIALDTNSGIVAYAAGCVAVLQGRQFQENIINTSKKAVTALAFSPDGRYLAVGESGHAPAVRVFEVSSRLQVVEFLGHKFGVTCVAFSPNNKYLVSIGTQHDMVTNVWNWRQGIKLASNKISSKVNGLTFSSDGTTFITIGIRHVKYWFLDESKRKTTIQNKNETVPLLGRNGLLGDQKTNVFVDVVCGKGAMSDSVYVLSQNGTLCQLIDRQISKTIDLKTIRAYCLQASETLIIVGCANGTVRVFDTESLQYMYTLHKPHPLGVSVITNTIGVPWTDDSYKYPDTLGLAFNPSDMTLIVVYSDHSLYKWDLSRLPQIGRISAALYHSSCVWAVDVLPAHDLLPADTFITCSSDDTIRFWNLHPSSFVDIHQKKSSFNHELLNIIYTDPSLGSLCEQEYNSDKPDIYESRNGVKCICTSPDGSHLASGDLVGNVRVHEISSMSELHLIEAHDTGVLCLEYSNFSTGNKYLVSASRDRLIHVFDASNEYSHLQTLSDHSSSICSVKLIPAVDGTLMISCANDKSLLFRHASSEQEELNFLLKQNLISKGTPNDMVIDPTQRTAATACQDRMIRLYNTQTAKQKRSYKGSLGDDGFLLKLTIDSTGTFLAVSCSDKSVAIIDFHTGEIVATLVGHSELITSLKFTNDCSHLISASADGCMFLWRLDDRLVERMLNAPSLKRCNSELLSQSKPDVTLVTPHQSNKPILTAGKSLGNLNNHEDFDETTFVVKQANSSSVLPAWAKESSTRRGKWDKDRATPVMTSVKNGQLHMSPDSAYLANGSTNIIPIAVQSQGSLHHGDNGEATDDEEDAEQEFSERYATEHSKSKSRPKLNISLNNNVHNYNNVGTTSESIYYQRPELDRDEDFTVTHRSYKVEDEKSSTSDAMSYRTMESEDDGVNTPRSTPASTPASSIPGTPVSPNSQLMDMIQQMTAANFGSISNGNVSNGSVGNEYCYAGGDDGHPLAFPAQVATLSGSSPCQTRSSAFVRVPQEPTPGSNAPSTSTSQREANPSIVVRKEAVSRTRTRSPSEDECTRPQQQRAVLTERLTSTEELPTGATSDLAVSRASPGLAKTRQVSEKEVNGVVTFSDIDNLCTTLRASLATAQHILTQVQNVDNSEKDYLVETLRDVSDGIHQMLPPTPQFEAIVHQTLHQFLHMNRHQKLLDKLNSDQSDNG